MEDFKNLNWSWKRYMNETDLKKSYHLNLTEDKKTNLGDYFHSQLLEIEHVHLMQANPKPNITTNHSSDDTHKTTTDTEILKDPRTGLSITNYTCDYRDTDVALRNIFLRKFIEKSKLSPVEHRAGVEAILWLSSHSTNILDEKPRICEIYFATQTTRFEEKGKYLQFLKNYFSQNLTYRYQTVLPPIDFFLQKMWKMLVIELLQSLADDYYRIATAFQLDAFPSNSVDMVLMDANQHGNVPEMLEKPDLLFLRKSSSQLIEEWENMHNEDTKKFIQNCVDPCRVKHDPNVIIPLSSICSVIDAAVSGKQNFMIRITIQENNEVVFEKALPPTELSALQKSRIGFKHLLQSSFQKNSSKTDNTKQHSVNHLSNEATGNSIESAIEYKTMEFSEYLKKVYKENEQKQSKQDHEEVGVKTPFKNCCCNLWELSERTDGQFSSNSSAVRMLVIHQQDAFRFINDNEKEFVSLSPKVEYQAEYGAEEMRLTELIQEWCLLYFQPNSIVYRVRCNVESGEIISRKFITLNEVTSELRSVHQIQSTALLSILWNTLRVIKNFPNGQYLLCHDKKNSHRIKVYSKRDETENALHLPTIYSNVTYETSPFDDITWQPIDNMIITDVHSKYKWLPCTFPHNKICKNLDLKSNTTQKLRINPKDDRICVQRRFDFKRKQMESKEIASKKFQSKVKIAKNQRRKMRKVQERNATVAEQNELMGVMKLYETDGASTTLSATAAGPAGLSTFGANSKNQDNFLQPHTKVMQKTKGAKSPIKNFNRRKSDSGNSDNSNSVFNTETPSLPTITRSGRLVKPKRF